MGANVQRSSSCCGKSLYGFVRGWLLFAQDDHGIDSACPACRHIAGSTGYGGYEQACDDKCDWVEPLHSFDVSAEPERRNKATEYSQTNADSCPPHSLLQH